MNQFHKERQGKQIRSSSTDIDYEEKAWIGCINGSKFMWPPWHLIMLLYEPGPIGSWPIRRLPLLGPGVGRFPYCIRICFFVLPTCSDPYVTLESFWIKNIIRMFFKHRHFSFFGRSYKNNSYISCVGCFYFSVLLNEFIKLNIQPLNIIIILLNDLIEHMITNKFSRARALTTRKLVIFDGNFRRIFDRIWKK